VSTRAYLFTLSLLGACSPGGEADLVTHDTVARGARLDGAEEATPGTTTPTEGTTAPPLATGDVIETPAPAPVATPEASTQPEPTATGEPRLVSFADLSLIGLDVDAIFDKTERAQGLPRLPPAIRELDRKLVSIQGYMIPMEWDGTAVKAFMLVRDMANCCFGQMPKPDEWVEVLMQEGKTAEYYPYVPVLATGILELAGEADDMGYVTGAYRLRGKGVTDEW
jgi:hypothetical protein